MRRIRITTWAVGLLLCGSCGPEPTLPTLNTNQMPTKRWDKTLGGSATDVPTAMVTTNDGGMVIAGYSSSTQSGNKTEVSRGGVDFWLVKVDANGQKVWEKAIGGSGDDYAMQLVALADGGFVVAGYSDSGASGDKTDASRGETDYWVVKVNSVGQKLWDKTYGGTASDEALAIALAPDGNFWLAGSSTSGIGGDKTERNYGERDYWVLKLSNTGQKLWDKTIGGRANDHLSCMALTPEGMLLVGSSNSDISNDKTERNKGDKPSTPDYWVVNINNDGQKLSDKTLGGNLSDIPTTVISDSKGGFVIAGYSNSGISTDKTESTDKFDNDYWLVGINGSGQKLWDKTLGGDQSDIAHSIIRPADGGFMVVGTSLSGVGRDKSAVNASSSTDYWLVKISESGQKIWDKTLLADQTENVPRLMLLSSNLMLIGASKSGMYGDKTEANRGDFDYWLLGLGFK